MINYLAGVGTMLGYEGTLIEVHKRHRSFIAIKKEKWQSPEKANRQNEEVL